MEAWANKLGRMEVEKGKRYGIHFVSNFKGTYRSRRRRHGYALETSLTDATLSDKAFLVQ